MQYFRKTLSNGFTIIELVVVISLIGLIFTIAGRGLGTFDYWKEEGFIRQISEIIPFLHNQAMSDQAFYILQFDFEKNAFRVMAIRAEDSNTLLPEGVTGNDIGLLTLELAFFLSPNFEGEHTLIPPPSFPSLSEPVKPPQDVVFDRIRTMRGIMTPQTDKSAYIVFSPRGFSEFAVINLKLSRGGDVTFLVNPFTGNVDIFREFRDFEWTFGRKSKT